MRMNFFGLLSNKSPMEGLHDHYEKIHESIEVINEALECYIGGGDKCPEFLTLQSRINELESQADKIIRHIRNHLPRGLFMTVDKIQFLNYTSVQDNILDAAQEALNWLGMREVNIPEEFQRDLLFLQGDVVRTLEMVGPALRETTALVHMESMNREELKESLRKIRENKDKVFRDKNEITRKVFNSDLEFKDIYQLIHYIDKLYLMAFNSSKCAEILRTMIAR